MSEPKFMLTNEQRKYVGLDPLERHWEPIQMRDSYYYFDGDIIKRAITLDEKQYQEYELYEQTAENKTIVLPKTKRGKPKKFNHTATRSFSLSGMYFSFGYGYAQIVNYTTQTNYYLEKLKKKQGLESLNEWLTGWMADSTEADLVELHAFKTAKRVHQQYKEGDIFAFKYGRRQYGFGKILIDVVKRRKTEEFKKNKNYGLDRIGTPLVVKVYHKISDEMVVDIDEMERGLAMPSYMVMDNNIYYGEYKIIGNRPVTCRDLDGGPIEGGPKNILSDKGSAFLQFGLIYREMSRDEYDRYKDREWYQKRFGSGGVGFSLNLNNLEQCIATQSNDSYYREIGYDMRDPANKKSKNEIFEAFGLDGDKDYAANMALAEKVKKYQP